MSRQDESDSFYELKPVEKAALLAWIGWAMRPHKTPNREHTSYGIKHCFEEEGFYVTNG